MTIKNEITGKYTCIGCKKEYEHPQEADACRDSHNLIYIAMSKEDLNRLLMFIQIKDDDLLTESLIGSLYRHRAYKGDSL